MKGFELKNGRRCRVLVSVGKADGRLNVVGAGGCLDKTFLNSDFPVERLSWVLYE